MSHMTRIARGVAVTAALGVSSLFATSAIAQVEVDPTLPHYEVVEGVSGTIKTVGSDTMNNMMALWGEGFQKFYPNVKLEVEGKGSSTAPPALIAGTSTFGPMSRKMKDAEIDAFQKEFGYKPIQLPAAIDMLAVYVHKDNPIANRGLTLPEVDAVFSKNRNLGYPKDITRWSQLGLSGSWGARRISTYGRNSASGTYGYFKKNVLGKGDYKDSVKEQPGSSAVVQGIARDRSGIGYSGIGYKTADVKAVPLAEEDGEPYIPAEADYAYNGDYPLSRFLLMSVNYKPGEELDPLRREFIKFIYSQEGQEAVVRDGYLPVTSEIANKALKSVGIK